MGTITLVYKKDSENNVLLLGGYKDFTLGKRNKIIEEIKKIELAGYENATLKELELNGLPTDDEIKDKVNQMMIGGKEITFDAWGNKYHTQEINLW